MSKFLRLVVLRLFFASALLFFQLGVVTETSQAHGGVVIDTGFTDHFEWLVSISPYPTLVGETMVTLLAYDITTYEPMNDLTVDVYLAAPDSTQPCCEPDVHRGPFALTIDPVVYPGDYSNPIMFDQAGEWQIQLVATVADDDPKNFTLVVPLIVYGSMGGSERIAVEANGTPDVDATATVFAQTIAAARQSNQSVATPAVPITATVVDSPTTDANQATDEIQTAPVDAGNQTNWWLWGGLGLLPILLIGWSILRTNGEESSSEEGRGEEHRGEEHRGEETGEEES